MHLGVDGLTERFDGSLLVLIHHLGPHIISRAQLGLTPGQVFMLHFLRQESQCSVSRLAERMEVAPSAITVMLDRLENHGFVRRTRDHSDRRVVIVEVTDAGEETLNQVFDVRKQIIQHCLTQVESSRLESFIETLEKVASIAQTMDLQAILEASNQEA